MDTIRIVAILLIVVISIDADYQLKDTVVIRNKRAIQSRAFNRACSIHNCSNTECKQDGGWNLFGSDWGCCGNYEGCCTWASTVCYYHDAICRCCDWWLCGPDCKKEPECLKYSITKGQEDGVYPESVNAIPTPNSRKAETNTFVQTRGNAIMKYAASGDIKSNVNKTANQSKHHEKGIPNSVPRNGKDIGISQTIISDRKLTQTTTLSVTKDLKIASEQVTRNTSESRNFSSIQSSSLDIGSLSMGENNDTSESPAAHNITVLSNEAKSSENDINYDEGNVENVFSIEDFSDSSENTTHLDNQQEISYNSNDTLSSRNISLNGSELIQLPQTSMNDTSVARTRVHETIVNGTESTDSVEESTKAISERETTSSSSSASSFLTVSVIFDADRSSNTEEVNRTLAKKLFIDSVTELNGKENGTNLETEFENNEIQGKNYTQENATKVVSVAHEIKTNKCASNCEAEEATSGAKLNTNAIDAIKNSIEKQRNYKKIGHSNIITEIPRTKYRSSSLMKIISNAHPSDTTQKKSDAVHYSNKIPLITNHEVLSDQPRLSSDTIDEEGSGEI